MEKLFFIKTNGVHELVVSLQLYARATNDGVFPLPPLPSATIPVMLAASGTSASTQDGALLAVVICVPVAVFAFMHIYDRTKKRAMKGSGRELWKSGAGLVRPGREALRARTKQ